MSSLLTIDPIAFEIFGLSIRWYAIFITSGMVLCLFLASLEAKRRQIPSDFVLELFIWCVPLAIVFARVIYVLAHPATYFPINKMDDFVNMFRINQGGLTIIGGIVGGLIGAIIVSKIKKMNFLELLDFGFPFMLLGQAIGRWGNYVNQEAYGKIVSSDFFKQFPIGVFIDRTAQWHYGTFFYEMVLNFVGFLTLYIIGRKTNRRGIVAVGYFVWYGIVRGFLEFVRLDAVVFNGIYITQLGSFIASGIGIVLIILMQKGVINFGISDRLKPVKEISNLYQDVDIITKDFSSRPLKDNVSTKAKSKVSEKKEINTKEPSNKKSKS